MALTVTHAKNVAIADDPKAAAAGEVLPSDWNANHVVSGVALQQAGGNLSFFVATTGSDSNNGTSSQTPFRTIQHGVSVLEGFNFEGIYQGVLNVASGTYNETVTVLSLFNGFTNNSSQAGTITGDTNTPTNVIVQPNNNTGDPCFTFLGGHWRLDGFSLRADTNDPFGGLLQVNNGTDLEYINLDFDIGSTVNCGPLISVRNHSRMSSSNVLSGTLTFHSSGGTASNVIIQIDRSSEFDSTTNPLTTYVFSTALNLGGGPFFQCSNFSLLGFFGGTFTNSGNVTGGTPISIFGDSEMLLFQDPLTVTWPSGPFDPTQVDASSNVDGLFYPHQIAGSPVDESTIYRGSWIVNKDTTNGPRYLSYDDSGTIHVRQIGRFINTQTSTDYTLQLFDQDGRVEMNNVGANTVTVPSSSTVNFPLGTEIKIVQAGAGATTPSTGAGATIHAVAAIGGQWKSATLYKRGADEWVQTSV